MSSIVDVEELGRRVRKLRLELRLTLKQVEEVSGLSATHLSEIERGRTSPTIGALIRIARALGKDASYLIEPEERPEIAHVSGSDSGRVALGDGAVADLLTPGIPGSRIFAYCVRLANGSAKLALPLDADANAICYVRSGNIETTVGGTPHRLQPGDALQACLSAPPELRAVTGDAEVLVLTTCAIDQPSPRRQEDA